MLRALLLLPLLALAACDSTSDSASPFDPNIEIAPVSSDDVREARSRWEASGGDDYTMALQRSCFCGPDALGPFEVRVRDGVVVSVNGGRVEPDAVPSILGLFDLLENALDRDAESVSAAFDPERGYPLRLFIDYNAAIADEEVGYAVADVRIN